MVLTVRKRDGRSVPFDRQYIETAVRRAYADIEGDLDQSKSKRVSEDAETAIRERFTGPVEIYEIQAVVEKLLLESGDETVARGYVNYRVARDLERARAIDVSRNVDRLVDRDAEIINENANKDAKVFHTTRDLTAGVTAKALGLDMLPSHVSNSHIKGEIHFHDLDYFPYTPYTNCCLPDFKSMLEDGYQMGNAQISSPQSINTASAQIAQIIANVSSSQYGGVTVNRVDELLAPYAQKNYLKHLEEANRWIGEEAPRAPYAEERTVKDIYDAMQALEYEVNTLQTSNGQTPFLSVGFGLGTSKWEREIQKAILKVRRKGLGKDGRTAIFPKLLFTLKRGVNLNPEDPNYDIKKEALACSTERMYPDVLNYDKLAELTGSFKACMGCRSFLQAWKDEGENPSEEGRMNLGVVTLNLPRIAIESDGNKNRFWKILDDRLQIVSDALLYRIQRVREAKPENAPILYQHGAFGKRLATGGDVNELFKNSRATISLGYIGLYEVATVFYGPEWETDEEAKRFTVDVLKRLSDRAKNLEDEHGYHFSVYGTPSESLTDRFCRLDKKKFGSIPNITDKDYYTNSFHYDVRKSPTPFEKIDFEAEYPQHSSGGFIHYCEYPVIQQNPEALEAVWDYAYDKVGYLGTNTPIDRCYKCGFSGEFEPTDDAFTCPDCGNTDPETCDVVKRTCGYLGNPQARPMAHGRHEEIRNRVKHVPSPTAMDSRSF